MSEQDAVVYRQIHFELLPETRISVSKGFHSGVAASATITMENPDGDILILTGNFVQVNGIINELRSAMHGGF